MGPSDKQHSESRAPLAWPGGRPPGDDLGAPYPDRWDANSGCLLIVLGLFAAASGVTCMIMRTSVPVWVYILLGIGAAPTAVCEIRRAFRRVRWHRAIKPINEQIEQRELILAEVWARHGGRLEEIARICGIVGDTMGWHGNQFLPDDPLAIVLWNHEYSRDAVTALNKIEEEFGLEIFCLAERIKTGLQENPRTTFGEFVDWVFEEREKSA